MAVEHINITLPVRLKAALDREARQEGTKRSTLIQQAVVLYLRVARQKTLREQLREGYVEMAAEARVVTKAFEDLDRETLKYAD